MKLPDLANHSWKPCTKCKDGIVPFEGKCPNASQVSDVGCVDGCEYCEVDCPHCQAHGVEPVAVENPLVFEGTRFGIPKLQVGVAFGICAACKSVKPSKKRCPVCDFDLISLIFLPLRQKVEGDNSIMMVVKVD